jgi:uncharacterized lipoprotein
VVKALGNASVVVVVDDKAHAIATVRRDALAERVSEMVNRLTS